MFVHGLHLLHSCAWAAGMFVHGWDVQTSTYNVAINEPVRIFSGLPEWQQFLTLHKHPRLAELLVRHAKQHVSQCIILMTVRTLSMDIRTPTCTAPT